MAFYLYADVSILDISSAHFWLGHQNMFYSGVYLSFCTFYSFIILVVWWVRWLRQRRIWQTWVWIWVSWYNWYRIGWIVVWFRYSCMCRNFCQWVVLCLNRVTCTPIIKYWWRVYQRMYRQCQYLFCYINVGWIMDWYNVCLIVWNGFIWVGVIHINMNSVDLFLIKIYNWFSVVLIYIIYAPNVFNLKIMLALIIFENFVVSKDFH